MLESENIAGKPREQAIVTYFQSRREAGLKASSLWCLYSKLNATFKAKYNCKLQAWPRLTSLLKSWDRNEERHVAATLSSDEVQDYIEQKKGTATAAIVACMFSGGMRACEVVSMEISDIVKNQVDGSFICTAARSKTGGHTKFHMSGIYASAMDQYLLLRPKKETKRLFLSERGTPIGKNKVYKLGYDVASVIGKPANEISKFTSHTFRRSAATAAAENGASISMMQSHFGWRNTSMPAMYVEQSTSSAQHMAGLLSQIQTSPGPGSPSQSQDVNININIRTRQE
eukprot:TRINITY_DN536_c1_g1_i2.p1 TRINITY_DN536_c1_g1~~TRINITY_DN536_c1_g1_i2.p1  ORF type:complete len:286 (-),score=20.74 TRINITY_DN536_c1_g1_i2:358-1215(-)